MKVDTVTIRGTEIEVFYESGGFRAEVRGTDGYPDLITADSLADLKRKLAAKQRVAAAKIDVPFWEYEAARGTYGVQAANGRGWRRGHVVGLNAASKNAMVRFEKGDPNEQRVHQHMGGYHTYSDHYSAEFGDLTAAQRAEYDHLIAAHRAATAALDAFKKQHTVKVNTLAADAVRAVTIVAEEGDLG